MTTGAYISGAAHVVFILFLLFGGLFTQSRLPEMQVADVSVLTAEEFAALTRPEEAPDVISESVAMPAPNPVEDAPEVAALPDAPPETPEVAQPDAPDAADTPTEVPPAPAPTPDAEVTDVLPPLEAPPVLDDRPDAPEEATPAPASRVAPEPAAPTPPDVETAPEVVERTAPDALPSEPEPPQEAAAPEEATTEIVTEAETPTLAPAASPRPRTRPQQPAEAPSQPVEQDVADASAGAAEAPAAPSGPPLSFGEREAFRVAVSACWDVDVGGRSADVTVVVAVEMNRDGTVVGNQVREVSVSGGDPAAQRTAFEKARRAILRCQRGGFPLPADKFDRWRQIEMTFNPEGMRLK